MRRLFIIFYVCVLAVLAAAWYVHGKVSAWQYKVAFQRVAEDAHRGWVKIILEELERVDHDRRREVLEQLQPDFDFPMQIVPEQSLPELTLRRLRTGQQTVWFEAPGEGGCIAAPLEGTHDALRLGPFPAFSHYEDSFAGGLQLAVQQLADPNADQRDQLQQLQQQFGYAVEILDEEELPPQPQQRIARGDETVFFVNGTLGYVATPLPNSQQVVRFGPFPNYEGAERRIWATTLAVVFILAALAIAFLLRPIAWQLRTVEHAAYSIADGELSARVDEALLTSARPLGHAFNEMADRTETLVRTQRELLQAVSHELRTPLARMRFAIDLIESADDPEDRRRRLASLDAATEELDGLVGELLQYVRMESAHHALERELVDLEEILAVVLRNNQTLFPNIELRAAAGVHETLVHAAPTDLQRVISNLVRNAARFAKQRVEVSAVEESAFVQIDVDDDGPGIPEADRQRVLSPFVRLEKNSGTGVGLGLAIVARTLDRYNGEVEILDSPLGGCRIRTRWPRPANHRSDHDR